MNSSRSSVKLHPQALWNADPDLTPHAPVESIGTARKVSGFMAWESGGAAAGQAATPDRAGTHDMVQSCATSKTIEVRATSAAKLAS
jgi:hypothetical protein